jgi:hypothetical protein
MTHASPPIDLDFNLIPGEDIETYASRIAAVGHKQVAEDIGRLKAIGEPINLTMNPPSPASNSAIV